MGVFLESKNIQVIMKTILFSSLWSPPHRLSKLAARRALAAASSMVLMLAMASSPGKYPSAMEDTATSAVEPSLETNTSSAPLTALDKPRTPAYTVRTGEWYLKRGDGTEKDHRVVEVHVHERYNKGKQFNNDIALMKLAAPVDFNGPYAGPACLPTEGKDYRGSQNCILSGWGLVKRWPQTLADRLQKVTGKIWGARDLLRQYYSLPDHVVGFGEPGRWSACMGDSGGPLVCNNGSGAFDVIGVVSFGPGTCSSKPGVFTEVSQYRDWLPRNLVAPSKLGSQPFS